MRTRFLLFVALVFSGPVFADTDADTVHFAAHFGLSYALETATYGVCEKALHLEREDAMILSAVTVFTLGVARQVMSAGGGPVNTNGIWQNALGIGASLGTVMVFDF